MLPAVEDLHRLLKLCCKTRLCNSTGLPLATVHFWLEDTLKLWVSMFSFGLSIVPLARLSNEKLAYESYTVPNQPLIPAHNFIQLFSVSLSVLCFKVKKNNGVPLWLTATVCTTLGPISPYSSRPGRISNGGLFLHIVLSLSLSPCIFYHSLSYPIKYFKKGENTKDRETTIQNKNFHWELLNVL